MPERITLWSGREFGGWEVSEDIARAYCNACDEFYDGGLTTEEERRNGVAYSDCNGGFFFMIER